MIDPKKAFASPRYKLVNKARLEHLASLNLDINKKSVLELGAGIGDHTQFFINRECKITSTEGRPENFLVLKNRFPNIRTILLDVDKAGIKFDEKFDIVYCYGLLYHLGNPFGAIEYMSKWCDSLLLLETIVSYDKNKNIDYCLDNGGDPTQSVSGEACRPSRKWIFDQLKNSFDFVYIPKTQPNFEELYPLDWTKDEAPRVSRAVFIASRQKIDNDLLLDSLPTIQTSM
jgi:hypothetical protein